MPRKQLTSKRLFQQSRAALLAGAVCFGTAQFAHAQNADNDIPEVQSFAGAYLAGRNAERQSDFLSAVEFYRQAVELDQENNLPIQRLFLSEIIVGNVESALAVADQISDVEGLDNVIDLTKAVEAVRSKKYKAAITLADAGLQSDLDKLIASVVVAWSQFGAGDVDTALEGLAALEGPQWYQHFTTLSSAYMNVLDGRNEAAIAAFKATLADREGGAAARDSYVRALEAYLRFAARIGDKESLADAETLINEIAPNSPILVHVLSKIKASEAVKNLITSPQDAVAELFYGVAMAINQPGSEPFVSRFLSFAAHLRPASDIIRFEQAGTFERLGLEEQAVQKWEAIEEDAPLWRLSQGRLALALEALERNNEAKERLQRSIALDVQDIGPYLLLGRLHARQKDYQSAATVYEDALLKGVEGSRLWTLYFQRGIAYERLKEWPLAEESFRESLRLSPNQPQVMNYLGYSMIDMDINLKEGLDLVKKAVELAPEDGAIADSLGWAYFKLGRFEEAVTELERAIQIQPGDPVINDHLGDAYWMVGRQNEGRYQWTIALDMDPTPEDREKIKTKIDKGLVVPAKAEQPATPVDEKETSTEKDDKA